MQGEKKKLGRPRGSKSAPSARRLMIYEQKKAGKTFREIANSIGISSQAVRSYFVPEGKAGTGTCSQCGKHGKIHRHHPDYGKVSDVVYLCPSCHTRLHFEKRREKAAQLFRVPDGRCNLAIALESYCDYSRISVVELSKIIGISHASLHRFIHGKDINHKSFAALWKWVLIGNDKEPKKH